MHVTYVFQYMSYGVLYNIVCGLGYSIASDIGYGIGIVYGSRWDIREEYSMRSYR